VGSQLTDIEFLRAERFIVWRHPFGDYPRIWRCSIIRHLEQE